MATTTIEIECVPGTTEIYATAAGGSGTASGSPYTPSQISGYLHSFNIPDNITGRWYFGAGDAEGNLGYRIIDNMIDAAITYAVSGDDTTTDDQYEAF